MCLHLGRRPNGNRPQVRSKEWWLSPAHVLPSPQAMPDGCRGLHGKFCREASCSRFSGAALALELVHTRSIFSCSTLVSALNSQEKTFISITAAHSCLCVYLNSWGTQNLGHPLGTHTLPGTAKGLARSSGASVAQLCTEETPSTQTWATSTITANWKQTLLFIVRR